MKEIGIVFNERPNEVVDLGTGYSNVHTNITEFTDIEDGGFVQKWSADVERVKNVDIENKFKYALLTFGQYFSSNCHISLNEGFDIGNATERYFTLNPPACKYNLQEDGTYEARLIMPLSCELQEKYADQLKDVVLQENYIPVDESIQQILVDLTSLDVLNWTLVQFSVAGGSENGLSLVISPETAQLLTPEIAEAIAGLGLKIEM